MFYLRRVVGYSMQPTLIEGQICLFIKTLHPKHGDIVLAEFGSKELVKRLVNNMGQLGLMGDNIADSLNISNINSKDIKGRLLWPKRAKLTL